jgi:hypothetical protein
VLGVRVVRTGLDVEQLPRFGDLTEETRQGDGIHEPSGHGIPQRSRIKRALLIEPGRNLLPSPCEQLQGAVEAIPVVDGGEIATWGLPRLELVLERFTAHILEHEPALRAQLRLSLEPGPPDREQLPCRRGRAIGWIEDALAPLREHMPAPELRRLVLAIRTTTGIEALVWLTDVAGLPREEATVLMRSSARALLRDACREWRGAGPQGDENR